MTDKQLFIFDLDGTLVNAYSAIEKSLNYALKTLGYDSVSLDTVKKSVGTGDLNFVKLFFKTADVDRALKIYRKQHKADLARFCRLAPYAKQVLNTLKRRKKIIAVASNRPRFYSDILINRLDIKKYFNFVVCADELSALKPNPKMINYLVKKFSVKKDQTVFIGDMDIDLETAKRAKVSAVYVSGGSSALSSVKKYKKVVAADLRDVLKI
ncbi:MAG: HAD family hydrolase [Candidatus Omnitrophica bacterium]|nr:HAD family hydrolase [Candidatus Omnitrophota bacterium]